jgi:hypothetical protein
MQDFRRCCVGIVLQWADISLQLGISDRISKVLSEVMESADAFGEKDGIAQLKLRLAIMENKKINPKEALSLISQIERTKLMKTNLYFQAKVLLEKAKALFVEKLQNESTKTISKSRAIAKSISDVSLVCEIDNCELFEAINNKHYKQAEELISKLQNSEWYKAHPVAAQNLQVWKSQVLYQARNFSSCLEVIDELLLTQLTQNQILIVLAIRAHIVLESKNGNLARVLVGKSKEIAEEGDLEFAKLLFSLWYKVLEQSKIEEATETSEDLVNIFLAEDMNALSKKSTETNINILWGLLNKEERDDFIAISLE